MSEQSPDTINGQENKIRYFIISPVRNEGNYIEKTIQSVLSQTIKPAKWIIVDDGSSDKTNAIVSTYAKNNPWIAVLSLSDRGYYDLMTGGEIRAFLKGYELIKNSPYDFLVKLDGDVSFNEFYFEDLFKEFDSNSKLGIASGACYLSKGNRLVLEKSYKLHVRGAGRIYRKKCWEDLGGAIDGLGWDAMDVYKARMLGWDTFSFEKIKMRHHVKTGAKGGVIHGNVREGRLDYLIGYHPLFFCLRVIKAFFKMPYIVSGIAYLFGYLRASVKNEKRVVDDHLMKYIRKNQICRIQNIFLKGICQKLHT